VLRFALLVLAGVGGGLTGSVAGLASLVSYPALLAAGLNPVAANVTNTVALVFSTAGSVSGSKRELTGQSRLLRRLAPASVLGGVCGGVLLLLTPADTFERFVPVLIGLAAIAVLLPRPTAPIGVESPVAELPVPSWLIGATFLIGVYSGFFGAAAGVLLLALLLMVSADSLPRVNAIKNVVLGIGNGVAAIAFVVFGNVAWHLGIPLALGLFVGGRLGPMVVRRVDQRRLRLVIALAGLGLAVKLGISAY
jgi:uncharacterized membrane protein YfcA